jgi:osmotically inducible lipoprotein OsmB
MRLKTIQYKVDKMSKKLLLALAAASTIAITGCASNPSNQQIGTGVGAVAGGVLGNALGGTAATVGGAAAGALIGNEVGRRQDNRR